MRLQQIPRRIYIIAFNRILVGSRQKYDFPVITAGAKFLCNFNAKKAVQIYVEKNNIIAIAFLYIINECDLVAVFCN